MGIPVGTNYSNVLSGATKMPIDLRIKKRGKAAKVSKLCSAILACRDALMTICMFHHAITSQVLSHVLYMLSWLHIVSSYQYGEYIYLTHLELSLSPLWCTQMGYEPLRYKMKSRAPRLLTRKIQRWNLWSSTPHVAQSRKSSGSSNWGILHTVKPWGPQK